MPLLRPLAGEGPVVLRTKTNAAWLPLALANLGDVLIDHAHCEKKAAANALSMLQAYPDLPGLPAQMARLAREESAHLAKVLELLEERGLTLGKDSGDPYAQALQKLIRPPSKERCLDRLLVAAVIEARSCERLALLADGLTEPGLKKFYSELARSEDGHQRLFVVLAERAFEPMAVRERLDYLLEQEAEILAQLPIRAAVH